MRCTLTYQQTDIRSPRELLESMIGQRWLPLQWAIKENNGHLQAESSLNGYEVFVSIQSTREPIKEITIVEQWTRRN